MPSQDSTCFTQGTKRIWNESEGIAFWNVRRFICFHSPGAWMGKSDVVYGVIMFLNFLLVQNA
ncbi:uncharacterized protein BDW43DRAFT_294511 [Aspergillus alliaceus]|uniref:uncharacterized protein n=1 Tax=Petromyces alliaceus TaxID=209559 RepID=UPI0012A5B271|nr:uncharacterized protein BDW43DRAFT_294511 [Aspergillus alliaceus]KAB8227280.1 hypothetical protein BDW43DRAFT_294511 [Aspergillus alliaceus]